MTKLPLIIPEPPRPEIILPTITATLFWAVAALVRRSLDVIVQLSVLREAAGFSKLFFGGHYLQKYAGCYGCGLPQQLCNSWVSNGQGGFRRVKVESGWRCEKKDFLSRVWICFSILDGFSEANEIVRGLGLVITDRNQVLVWLGQKYRVGELEGNNLCRAVLELWKGWKLRRVG